MRGVTDNTQLKARFSLMIDSILSQKINPSKSQGFSGYLDKRAIVTVPQLILA